MNIVRKRFDAWSKSMKRRLRYATIYGGYLKRYMSAFPQSPTIVVCSQSHIMGWAFALGTTHNNTVSINLFVNERYRGRGLATLLIEESLKDFKIISLAQHNNGTKRLFKRLQRKHPRKIIVFDWWKYQYKYAEIVQRALES